jgi:hypothetical protein
VRARVGPASWPGELEAERWRLPEEDRERERDPDRECDRECDRARGCAGERECRCVDPCGDRERAGERECVRRLAALNSVGSLCAGCACACVRAVRGDGECELCDWRVLDRDEEVLVCSLRLLLPLWDAARAGGARNAERDREDECEEGEVEEDGEEGDLARVRGAGERERERLARAAVAWAREGEHCDASALNALVSDAAGMSRSRERL